MLWKEELVQEPVHLQETFTVDSQAAIVEFEEALPLQLAQALGESLPQVNTELGLEVSR